MQGPKVAKKCLKLVKKAAKDKKIRRGVKEVVKALKKKEKGYTTLNVPNLQHISNVLRFWATLA